MCKLDMEKAYNHVDWDFLLYMLKNGFWRYLVQVDKDVL